MNFSFINDMFRHMNEFQEQSSIERDSFDGDPYEELCISRDATEEEISKQYKKLSLKWHPDRNLDNIEEATKKFQRINSAKQAIDSHRNNNKVNLKPEPIIVTCKVSLEDLYTGYNLNFKYKRNTRCKNCDGWGVRYPKNRKTCRECHGDGFITKQLLIVQIQRPCSTCKGKGIIIRSDDSLCSLCRGRGIVKEQVIKDITIPPGTLPTYDENSLFLIEEIGNELSHIHREIGDVCIVLEPKAYKGLSLTPTGDLYLKCKISLYQALKGYTIGIKHLDGRIITVNEQCDVMKPNSIIKIEDEGFKKTGTDLYVKIRVIFPDSPIPSRQLNKIKKYIK